MGTFQRKMDNDYIWLDNDGEILLDLNLRKKRHDPILFSITKDTPELANIFTDSNSLYPRDYVFTPKNTYPNLNKKASQASLDARLRELFYLLVKTFPLIYCVVHMYLIWFIRRCLKASY